MLMPERSYTATTKGYRFGFNGKEQDNEVNGEGNAYDFGARMYDSRLGRWMSVDPLFKKYPGFSPYNFATNSPIYILDFDGRDIIPTNLFNQTAYRDVAQKLVNHKDAILFSSKYLTQFMGDDKHLRLGVRQMEPKVLAQQPGKSGNKSLLYVNPNAIQIPNQFKEQSENDFPVVEQTELSMARTLIHEIAFHAARENGDHKVGSDMMIDAVESLKQYSSAVMGEEISNEVAISMVMEGVGSPSKSKEGEETTPSHYDNLLSTLNEHYGTSLTSADQQRINSKNAWVEKSVTVYEYQEATQVNENMDNQKEESPITPTN
ncbi:MAG: RHS repeat-associated protein [Halioglobus sp.]|jgi:RHS repeat-associated protein